ncbi:GIY-YIG nuclease family protein [Candidatus Dependentiae bacterium]|nr:GIY-YIG nuclease family protein [Candidatus Dependentiae bacterium]
MLRPKNLPKNPGVYIFRNKQEQIIYIGKAKSIAKRIASYFNNPDEFKVEMILQEAITLETIPVSSELEALHLEAELVKKYKPKYNILLKEGNPFIYLFFSQGQLPVLTIVRTKEKKGTYVGPFLSKKAAHSVFNFLIETFKLKLCKKKIPHGCLQYHIGICAGYCSTKFDFEFYKLRLELAKFLATKEPEKASLIIDEEIKKSSQELKFERAKKLLEYKKNFEIFSQTVQKLAIMPSRKQKQDDSKNLDILIAIQKRLGLKHVPYVIDCFDISHLQSQAIVGSCIRYVDGNPEPNSFRRFQIKSLIQQNDYAALQEIVQRRYKGNKNYPNLIIVDGGKGQINAIKPYVGTAELVGLAKKEETIISSNLLNFIKLDHHRTEDLLLLQIRDKTHNFAIAYHRKKRSKSLN